MSITELHPLDLLILPMWIVSPHTEELVFASVVTRELMQVLCSSLLHKGVFSIHTQDDLTTYFNDLKNHHDIIEILTVCREGEDVAMASRLPIRSPPESGDVIPFEGIETPTSQNLRASRSVSYQWKRQGFYARSFQTDSAPMLLVDPSHGGFIVDINLSALDFYSCSYDMMCQKHIWEINALGRYILPVTREIAHLPDGHEPLHLVYKLVDGTPRHVQTYARLAEIYGNKLVLYVIHDIIEQERLEQELGRATLCDALTGLFNRRHSYQVTEPEQTHMMSLTQGYSLLLADTDRSRSISDLFGHLKGGEVLCALVRTLESCTRKDGLIFRWGGEEFVLLLLRASLDTTLSLAEAIQTTVAKVILPGLPCFIVSIGVARHEINESINELFKRADDVLYKAKNEGRDRVLAA